VLRRASFVAVLFGIGMTVAVLSAACSSAGHREPAKGEQAVPPAAPSPAQVIPPSTDSAPARPAASPSPGAASGPSSGGSIDSETSRAAGGPGNEGATEAGATAGTLVGVPPPDAGDVHGKEKETVPKAPPRATGAGGGGGGGSQTRRDNAAAAPRVTMLAPSPSSAIGTRIRVPIEIAGAANVGSVPFHVVFDPAVLRFERGEEGSFLRSDGRSTAFFAAPVSGEGEVVIGLSRLGPGTGAEGRGDLCLLEFTVVGPGPARLAFDRAHVRDSSNRIVAAEFQVTSAGAE
jgi:cohesin domain-containing protein